MAATYEPIATTTLGSAGNSLTFSSIPATYTDLRLVVVAFDASNDSTTANLFFQFNTDTGSNYSSTHLRGNGSAASSTRLTNTTVMPLTYQTSLADNTTTPTMGIADIFSYAGSTYKTALILNANDQNGSGSVEAFVGLWRNTAAINEIKVFMGGGLNLKAGTTATLYGILKA